VPDELTDQVVAGDRMYPWRPDVAQGMQDRRHPHGHRRLAGPRAAREARVQRGLGRRQSELPPGPVDLQQRRDLTDPTLDRRQADQLGFEGSQGLLGPGGRLVRREVDHRVIGEDDRFVRPLLVFRRSFRRAAGGRRPVPESLRLINLDHPPAYRSPAGLLVA
jgi:hypothetical protein